MDKDLCVYNDGPPAFGGPVVDALEKFEAMLKDPSASAHRQRLRNLTDQFFEKPLGLYSSFLTLSRQNKENIATQEGIRYFQALN